MTQDEVKELIKKVKGLTYRDLDKLEEKDVWAFSEVLHNKLATLERVKYSRIKQAWAGHGAYRDKEA